MCPKVKVQYRFKNDTIIHVPESESHMYPALSDTRAKRYTSNYGTAFCDKSTDFCGDYIDIVSQLDKCDDDGSGNNYRCENTIQGYDCISKKNYCTCNNGDPKQHPKCKEDNQEDCETCDPGYQLDPDSGRCIVFIEEDIEDTFIEEINCTCTNGQPKIPPECSEDAKEDCESCDPGFQLDSGRCVEKINYCFCRDGEPKTLPNCVRNGKPNCLRCNTGYHRSVNPYGNVACFKNKCKCSNGSPKTGPDCKKHGKTDCATCHTGFYLEYGQCWRKPNVCECLNGSAKTGPDCRKHGETDCSSCHPGFHPQRIDYRYPEKECKPNICDCPNGSPRTGSSCKRDGQKDCFKCDLGYHPQIIDYYDSYRERVYYRVAYFLSTSYC